eukprot:7999128-Ditylum_brightwellii.AAC.1
MNSSVKNKKQLHFSVAIWHDDFDPSGSNKKNTNNAWILTLTFHKQRDNSHNIDNTFIISLGKKGINHDYVFHWLKSDIEVINGDDKLFYCKPLGGSIQVCLDIAMDLADSSKFHDCKHVAHGNSTHTSLWRWVIDLGSVWDKFKS